MEERKICEKFFTDSIRRKLLEEHDNPEYLLVSRPAYVLGHRCRGLRQLFSSVTFPSPSQHKLVFLENSWTVFRSAELGFVSGHQISY